MPRWARSCGRTWRSCWLEEPVGSVRRLTVVRAVLVCLVVLGSMSACGADTGEPAAGGGAWTERRIEVSPGADTPIGFAAEGDDVLVAVLDEGGILRSELSTDGGDFRAGEPFDTGGGAYPGFADPVRLDGVWWLVGAGGAAGEDDEDDEEPAFGPRALRSADGLTWESVDVAGIPAPVDISAVAAVAGTLVAVGAMRNGIDTGGAGLEAAVWRSEDGSSWTQVALPGVVPEPTYREESYAGQVGLSGDRLLVGGSLSQRAAVWSSTDAGRSWDRVESPAVDELYSVSGLVADDSVVLVSGSPRGEDSGSRILRSDDGGATFLESAEQPAADGEGFAPLWGGAGRFFTVTEPSFDVYSDPAVCYADIEQCRDGAASDVEVVQASDDGDAWSVVDLADLGVGDELVGVVGTDGGRVVLAHVVKGALVLHTWSAGPPLPEGSAPKEPERVDLVTVPEGEDPEPGARYHAPLYLHCGMEWLYLGDQPWQRTDGGPDIETGAGEAPDDGWPVAGEVLFGYATLGPDGVVSYADDKGRLIATYERTGVQPPGCD